MVLPDFFTIANLIDMTWCHFVLITLLAILGGLHSILLFIGHWGFCFICPVFSGFLLLQWIGRTLKTYPVYHLLSFVCPEISPSYGLLLSCISSYGGPNFNVVCYIDFFFFSLWLVFVSYFENCFPTQRSYI